MSIEVHIDWKGISCLVGRLDAAERSASVAFAYAPEWLERDGAFAIDPTSLPLQRGVQHARALFGVMQDCGPDRWGRILIERAVRKKVLPQKPYRDIDYVLALDDMTRVGALRFRPNPENPFLAPTSGKLPPLVRLNALLHATDAVHSETETAQDLRFLLGAGSPLGGARPKAVVRLADGRLALAKFPKPDDTRDIGAGEILAMSLAARAGIRVADHYDDHLRNHGFLMFRPGHWSLSLAYDLNPVPEVDRVRVSKTAITEDQETPTIAVALAAAERFGLRPADARKILREVFAAVSGWHKTGRELHLSAAVLDSYASAFEHPLMVEAASIPGE